jgi:hypothetical protein
MNPFGPSPDGTDSSRLSGSLVVSLIDRFIDFWGKQMRQSRVVRVCFWAMCVSLALARAQNSPIVWVASGLERINPDAPAQSAGHVVLYAAKGEYEPFQLIVHAPQNSLTNVNVSVSDLNGPGSSIIANSNITLYREQYVYLSQPSLDFGVGNRSMGAGWYPDGLIPFIDPSTGRAPTGAALTAVPFNVNANKNQPIWADVFVPRDATPGQYLGTAVVTSDQGGVTIPITLNVWHFTLPLKPSLKSSFGMHAPLNADTGAQQLLLSNKLSPFTITPSDSRLLIDNFGLNASGLYFFSGSSRSNCTMAPAPTLADIAAQAARYSSDLLTYIYSADEIDPCTNLYDTVRQWARAMHQVGVPNLATMTPNPVLYDDGSGTGHSAVDIWVLLPAMYNSAPSFVADVIRKGDSVWSYNAEAPDADSPRWQIDFSPLNYRLQAGFINQSLGLTGLLYWRVDLFSSDPWNNVEPYTASGGVLAGEGMLIYPGAQVGTSAPAPSMRLKYLRDGVEDYEYVEIAKSLGQGDWALSVAKTVGPDWKNWTRDPGSVLSARLAIGQKLDSLTSGSPGIERAGVSRGAPSGSVMQQPIELSVSTDMAAVCRYATSSGLAFASMPSQFASTGGTAHSTALPNLPSGSYHYYVRCQSMASGVADTSDYAISFTVGWSFSHIFNHH